MRWTSLILLLAWREGHSPATGELRHTWLFRVDATGKVFEEKMFGDFPPQMAK